MTTTHTPGPWTLERDRAKSLSLYGADGTFIGEVYHAADEPSPKEEANAHLLKAAPALYAALGKLRLEAIHYKNTHVGADFLNIALTQAAHALAQADGKAQP